MDDYHIPSTNNSVCGVIIRDFNGVLGLSLSIKLVMGLPLPCVVLDFDSKVLWILFVKVLLSMLEEKT